MRAFLASAAAIVSLAGYAGAQPVIFPGVPDWHQAGMINPPNGPGGNPNGPYRAWCSPTAAANIMGYWEDVRKYNVADGFPFFSGNLFAWTPPVPNNWQDFETDASSVPIRLSGLARPFGMDLGWYLNTNDQGDQFGMPWPLPNNGGGPVGEQFTGTKRVNIPPGLQNFLAAHGQPLASVTVVGGGVPNIAAGWAQIVAEINAGRPLLGEFDHFNINPIVPGSSIYLWGSWGSMDPATGEVWDPSQGLGHSTTIVGYWMAGSTGNPFPNSDAIIVQDNRRYTLGGGLPEPDNQFMQIILPFSALMATPWDRNVAIDLCQPIHAAMGGGGAICPGTFALVTVTMSAGSPPFTVTLSDGSVQNGPSPLVFSLSPAVTTNYTVVSGSDLHGCPVTNVGVATVTVNPVTGACCTGYGTGKTCAVVLKANCMGGPTPSLRYGGDCSVCVPGFCRFSDYNNSGALTIQDIFDFIADWFALRASTDYNNSGSANVQDIFDFLSGWFAGV